MFGSRRGSASFVRGRARRSMPRVGADLRRGACARREFGTQQAESTSYASPRASWFVLAHNPRRSLSRRLLLGLSASSRAARARLAQARRDCQAPGNRGGRSDPRRAGGLARVSGSPVSGAPLGCQPEPGRAPMPGYPLESPARRGPSPPLQLIGDGSHRVRDVASSHRSRRRPHETARRSEVEESPTRNANARHESAGRAVCASHAA